MTNEQQAAPIEFPAPEEVRSYGEFAKLFRARNPCVDFKKSVEAWEQLRGMPHNTFFANAWSQPEAEAIHAAYQGH